MKYYNHANQSPYAAFLSSDIGYSQHHHEQIEISCVQSGEAIYTTGQGRHILHTDELIILFPYEAHTFTCSKEDCILTILFDIDFIPDFQRRFCEYELPDPIFRTKKLEPSSRHALKWLKKYISPDASISPEIALQKEKGWLTVLLGDIFYKCDLIKRKDKLEPELIRNMLAYMENNIAKGFTADELTKELGVSQNYLSHSLKNLLHVSYNALLTFVKLNHAEELLKTSEDSLLEIALASGFQNIQTFTRNYKKATGMTPYEFQKQQKQLLK